MRCLAAPSHAAPAVPRHAAPTTPRRRITFCLTWILFCAAGVEAGTGPPTCNLGAAVSYGLRDSAMFCFFLSTSPVKKMIFRLKVDELSTVILKGSQKFAVAEGQSQPVYTWVTGTRSSKAHPLDCTDSSDLADRGHSVSCPQVFTTGSHVAQVLNLVINLKNGHLSSFAWDNGCAACSPSSCIQSSKSLSLPSFKEGPAFFSVGACGEDLPKCPPDDENSCDMKVFVSWAGTDKDGRNLVSAGTRLSKFTGPTLKSVYGTMNDNYNSI